MKSFDTFSDLYCISSKPYN